MNNTQFPAKLPALRVVQPLGEFLAVVLPARLVLQVTYSDPLKLEKTTDGYNVSGHQRKVQMDRIKQIGSYIDGVESAFPNSIILAANYSESGEYVEDADKRWSLIPRADCFGGYWLYIPTAERLAAIVDGQHRLYGFTTASRAERRDMPLLCSVFLDLPNPFQAYLFATINSTQKSVDKSQTYELYGYDLYNLEEEPADAWTPEKTAVFLCRKLNVDTESALKDHIIVATQDSDAVEVAAKSQNKQWGVSTATIVQGIIRLISSNPVRDRDEMNKYFVGKGRSRGLLRATNLHDNSPLRQYYILGNDALIFAITRNFFSAVSEVLWDNNPRSYIRKTVGFQALFDILRGLSVESIGAKDVSVSFFKHRLVGCKNIDFSDNFFQASGTGRTRIRNVLQICMDLKTLDSMGDESNEYARILKRTSS